MVESGEVEVTMRMWCVWLDGCFGSRERKWCAMHGHAHGPCPTLLLMMYMVEVEMYLICMVPLLSTINNFVQPFLARFI